MYNLDLEEAESLWERFRDYFSEKVELIKEGEWGELLRDRKFLAIVAGILLAVGGVLFLYFNTAQEKSEITAMVELAAGLTKVCVTTPEGIPIPDATLRAGDVTSRTGKDGCGPIPESSTLSVEANGFKPYHGPFRRTIQLSPLLPQVTVLVRGTDDGLVRVEREGRVLWEGSSGGSFYISPHPLIEGKGYVYPEKATIKLYVEGKVVDEKPVPAEGGVVTLKTKERVGFSGTFSVTVEVEYSKGYSQASLSVVDSEGKLVYETLGRPPFHLGLPLGEYTFTAHLLEGGKVVGKGSKKVYIDRDLVVMIPIGEPRTEEGKEMKMKMVKIRALVDGTVYVKDGNSVVLSLHMKAGEEKNQLVPENSTLIFISDNGRVFESSPALDEVRFGKAMGRALLLLHVLKGGKPVQGARVSIHFRGIRVLQVVTDEGGGATIRLPKGIYRICARFEGLKACKDVTLTTDKEETIDLLEASPRTVQVTYNGRPVDGSIVVDGKRIPVKNGKALVPEGTYTARVETAYGSFDVTLRDNDRFLELKSGRSTNSRGTLIVKSVEGAVTSVLAPSGDIIYTVHHTSDRVSLPLDAGRYRVQTLARGVLFDSFVRVEDGEIEINHVPPSDVEAFSLTVKVVNNPGPVEILLSGGQLHSMFRAIVEEEIGLELKRGMYHIRASLGSNVHGDIVKVPEKNFVLFDFNGTKPFIDVSITSMDGKRVRRAEEDGSYLLRVKAFIPTNGTLSIKGVKEPLKKEVSAGYSEHTFPISPRGGKTFSPKIGLRYGEGVLAKTLSIPLGKYEVLCNEKGICFGSGVEKDVYTWTIVNESGQDLDYQVLAGDTVLNPLIGVKERINRGEKVEESTSTVWFVMSRSATHLLLLRGKEYERIVDPVDDLFSLPNAGILQVEPPKIPPSGFTVNARFSSDVEFRTVNFGAHGIEEDGSLCSARIRVHKGNSGRRYREGGGYIYFYETQVYLAPGDDCNRDKLSGIVLSAYSRDGAIKPATALVEVTRSNISVQASPAELGPGEDEVTLMVANHFPFALQVKVEKYVESKGCKPQIFPEDGRDTWILPGNGRAEIKFRVDNGDCRGDGNIHFLVRGYAEVEGTGTLLGEAQASVPYRFYEDCLEVEVVDDLVYGERDEIRFRLVNRCGVPVEILDISPGWGVERGAQIKANDSAMLSRKVDSGGSETLEVRYTTGLYTKDQTLTLRWYRTTDLVKVNMTVPEDLEELRSYDTFPPGILEISLEREGFTVEGMRAYVDFNTSACENSEEVLRRFENDVKKVNLFCNGMEKVAKEINRNLRIELSGVMEEPAYLKYYTYAGSLGVRALRYRVNEKILDFVVEINVTEGGDRYLVRERRKVRWEPDIQFAGDLCSDFNRETGELNVHLQVRYNNVQGSLKAWLAAWEDENRGGVEYDKKTTKFKGGERWEKELTMNVNEENVIKFRILLGEDPYTYHVRLTVGDRNFPSLQKECTIETDPVDIVLEEPQTPDVKGIADVKPVKLLGVKDLRPVAYVNPKYLADINRDLPGTYVDALLRNKSVTAWFSWGTLGDLNEAIYPKMRSKLEGLKDCLEGNITDFVENFEEKKTECMERCKSLCEEAAKVAKLYVELPILFIDEKSSSAGLAHYNLEINKVTEIRISGELNLFAEYYPAFRNLFSAKGIKIDESLRRGMIRLSKNGNVAMSKVYPFKATKGCGLKGGQELVWEEKDGHIYGALIGTGELSVSPKKGRDCHVYRWPSNEEIKVDRDTTVSLYTFVDVPTMKNFIESLPPLAGLEEGGNLYLFIPPSWIYERVVKKEVGEINFHLDAHVCTYRLPEKEEVSGNNCLYPSNTGIANPDVKEYPEGSIIAVPQEQLKSICNISFGELSSWRYVPFQCRRGEWNVFHTEKEYMKALMERYLPYDEEGYREMLEKGYPTSIEVDGQDWGYEIVALKPLFDLNEGECKDFYDQSGHYVGWIAELNKETGETEHTCQLLEGNDGFYCLTTDSKEEKYRVGDKLFEINVGNRLIYTEGEPAQYTRELTCSRGDYNSDWEEGGSKGKHLYELWKEEKNYIIVAPKELVKVIEGGYIEELNTGKVTLIEDGQPEDFDLFSCGDCYIKDGTEIVWHSTGYRYRFRATVNDNDKDVIYFSFDTSHLPGKVKQYDAIYTDKGSGRPTEADYIVFYLGKGLYGALLEGSPYLYFNVEGGTCLESGDATCTGARVSDKGSIFKVGERIVLGRPPEEGEQFNYRTEVAVHSYLREPEEVHEKTSSVVGRYVLGFAKISSILNALGLTALSEGHYVKEESEWNFGDGTKWIITVKEVPENEKTIVPVIGPYDLLKGRAYSFDPKNMAGTDIMETNLSTHLASIGDNVDQMVSTALAGEEKDLGNDMRATIGLWLFRNVYYLGEDWFYLVVTLPNNLNTEKGSTIDMSSIKNCIRRNKGSNNNNKSVWVCKLNAEELRNFIANSPGLKALKLGDLDRLSCSEPFTAQGSCGDGKEGAYYPIGIGCVTEGYPIVHQRIYLDARTVCDHYYVYIPLLWKWGWTCRNKRKAMGCERETDQELVIEEEDNLRLIGIGIDDVGYVYSSKK